MKTRRARRPRLSRVRVWLSAIILPCVVASCSLLDSDDSSSSDNSGNPPGTVPAEKSVLVGVRNAASGGVSASSVDLYRWNGDGDYVIRPDAMRIAYKWIALVTDGSISRVTLENGLTESSNRAILAADAYVMLDRTGADDDPMVFDLGDAGYPISMDTFPAAGVQFSALAAEPVFYEAQIDDYGTLRAMVSDYTLPNGTQTYAGDLMVLRNGEPAWEWVYVKAGDGIDGMTGTSGPSWADLPGGVVYATQTDSPDDIGVRDFGWYGPVDSGSGSYEPAFFAGSADAFGYFGNSGTPVPFDAAYLASHTAFRYWVAGYDAFLMSGNLATPQLSWDSDLGGYGTAGTIAGTGEGISAHPNARMFTVYYEPDLHAGIDDMASVFYSPTRLAGDPDYRERTAAETEYGAYLWDSGLYLPPFAFSSLIVAAENRILINSCGNPDGFWAFTDDIGQITVELHLGSAVTFGKDRGSGIADFGERFITDVPLWVSDPGMPPVIPGGAPLASDDVNLPLNPIANVHGFFQTTGAGASTTCNIDFGFITGDVNVDIGTRTIAEITVLPPMLSPEPGIQVPDDPADTQWGICVSVVAMGNGATVFYTTDGSDPAVTVDGTPTGTTQNAGDERASIDIGTTTTVVKAVCWAPGKIASAIVGGEYRFD